MSNLDLLRPDDSEIHLPEGFQIHSYGSPFNEEVKKHLDRFYAGLRKEQEQFQLPLEKIQSSLQLCILTNDQSHAIGVSGLRSAPLSHLFFLVVHEEFQGRGLGKALSRTILENRMDEGTVLLTVQRSNLKARKLYKSIGFKTIARQGSNVIMIYQKGWRKWTKAFYIFLIYIRGLFKGAL